jgi:pimeloyl-ACP methyl ester carboxylesterase
MSFQQLKFRLLVSTVSVSLNTLSYIFPKLAGRKAAELFGKPRKGKLTDADRDRLKTADWHTLHFNDMPVQCYQWQGDASKTVVLVHGWESNAARWYPLVKLLKKENYNIIAFDAPAHGGSGSVFFDALLFARMLNVVVQHYRPQYLVGHSVGAYAISYWVGFFFRKNADVEAENTPLSTKPEKFVFMASPSDIGKVFNKFLDFIKANARVSTAFYAHYEQYAQQKIADITAEKNLKDLTINALVIHDKDDEVIEFTEGGLIHAALPHSKWVVTEKLGHRLRDGQVYQQVVDFLSH